MYCSVLAGAGNETTGRLIGWLAKVLADHPDQRRDLVADRSLLDATIDETLRFEPTGSATSNGGWRTDVDYHGTTVPAGSAMMLLVGAANRDPRRYERPDEFDLHRARHPAPTFGWGDALLPGRESRPARGRVALDEFLDRFPSGTTTPTTCGSRPPRPSAAGKSSGSSSNPGRGTRRGRRGRPC